MIHGYAVEIHQDSYAGNPWKEWDTEPPIMVFNLDRHHGRIETYGTELSLLEILNFRRDKISADTAEKLRLALNAEDDEWREALDYCGGDYYSALRDFIPDSPSYYSEAKTYFSTCGDICRILNIPYHSTSSNGYCQGDSALLFFAASPEWLELTGVKPENAESALEGSGELWGQWAWGDVYGIASITRLDGTEMDDGSVWGYYGGDHKKSGLIESATLFIQHDMREQEREAVERERCACADILTV